jgi:hypothetical protein
LLEESVLFSFHFSLLAFNQKCKNADKQNYST